MVKEDLRAEAEVLAERSHGLSSLVTVVPFSSKRVRAFTRSRCREAAERRRPARLLSPAAAAEPARQQPQRAAVKVDGDESTSLRRSKSIFPLNGPRCSMMHGGR